MVLSLTEPTPGTRGSTGWQEHGLAASLSSTLVACFSVMEPRCSGATSSQHPHSGLQGTSSRRPDLLLSASSWAPEAAALGRGLGVLTERVQVLGAGTELPCRPFRKGL